MHPEADAFLDAIFDHPDDDTPRLVYADWLQEHGQENYAQFIRLQCAAAREKPWSDEANRLWEEIGRVWNRLDDEWWPAMRKTWMVGWRDLGTTLDAIHFERGFLRPGISLMDWQFLDYLDAEVCWRLLPPSSSLLLTEEGDWESLSNLPQLRRVLHLRLLDGGEDDGGQTIGIPDTITKLLRSVHLCRVKTLDLSGLWLTQRAVDALLAAPNLSSVQRLTVWFHRHRSPDRVKTMKQLEARFNNVIGNLR
jgi:uncharacterized protein (TIGR02996 family)